MVSAVNGSCSIFFKIFVFGVVDRAVVLAPEGLADVGVGQLRHGAGQIHGQLPRQDHGGRTLVAL